MVTQKMGTGKYLKFWEKAIGTVHQKDPTVVKDMIKRTWLGEDTFPSSPDVGTPEQIENQTFLKIPQNPALFPKECDFDKLHKSLVIFYEEYVLGCFGPVLLVTEESLINLYGNRIRWYIPGFLVPKPNGKSRQIRNYAKGWTNDNPEKRCVNDTTDLSDARMSTASRADVGAFCLEHKYSAKLDLSNAFRHRRVAPRCVAGQCYLLLGFMWNGIKCFYMVPDMSAVMGRRRTPNAFCDHPNTLVNYLEKRNSYLWRTNRRSYPALGEMGLTRQEGSHTRGS
jgi:hypothetical protein